MMRSTRAAITSYSDKSFLPCVPWFAPRVWLHTGPIPHALISDSSGFRWVPLPRRWTQHYLCLVFPGGKKKVKIFYMLFKLINITNPGQFGKSVLWLEAHFGSAHLVKLNLAEASFCLWRVCHLEPINHGDVPSFPSPRMHVSFYLPITSLPAIYLPWDFFFLIFNTSSKLYLCNLFTRCDHQTKTRKRLKLIFPSGWNLISRAVLFTYHW